MDIREAIYRRIYDRTVETVPAHRPSGKLAWAKALGNRWWSVGRAAAVMGLSDGAVYEGLRRNPDRYDKIRNASGGIRFRVKADMVDNGTR